jgi:DNA-binding LacI/PurR family transcriptional regulator
VSLISFDAPAWADVVTPPLSVMRPPTAALAERAWAVLVDRMHHRGGRPQRIVLGAHLELRASVAPPARKTRGRLSRSARTHSKSPKRARATR